jgi:hypothetical protein
MRKAAWIVVLGTLLAWLWIGWTPSESTEASLSPGVIQLELPELGERRYAPGVLRIPEPQDIRRLVLHIPLTRIQQAYPRINTIGIGVVQTIRARKDEVLCEIDLSLNRGHHYTFGAADNTVEIKVVPGGGAEPLYAKWVIAPPKEQQGWQAHQSVASAGSPAPTEMSKEGLVLLEELEDGRQIRLEKGITTARRIFLQASFPRREESVSLRVHWVGEEGAERTFSVGSWRGGSGARGVKAVGLPTLEGALELTAGENRLESLSGNFLCTWVEFTRRVSPSRRTDGFLVPTSRTHAGDEDFHSESSRPSRPALDAGDVRKCERRTRQSVGPRELTDSGGTWVSVR